MRLTKTTNLTHGLLLTGLFLASSLIFNSHATHAATLTPSVGTDELTANSNCSLSEAITNINDQSATYTECGNTGDAYGTNDTINIPSGTLTLYSALPEITKSVAVHGSGIGRTVLDGKGLYSVLVYRSTANGTFSVSDLRITGINGGGILAQGSGDFSFSRLDIDGDNSNPSNWYFALAAVNDGTFDVHVNMKDIYVHDVTADTSSFTAVGAVSDSDANMTVDFENVTIANITNSGSTQAMSVATNTAGVSPTLGNIVATMRNITINNIISEQAISAGLGSIAFGIENTVDVTASNITVDGLHGVTDSFLPGRSSAAIFSATAGFDGVLQPHAGIDISNAHITDGESCAAVDIGPIIGAPGTGLTTITSTGGNVVEDNYCSSYATQPTDKNNITNLKDFLGPLSNSGGYVPTMPLLAGSPAIDSGVTVAGLTTDARGVTRPQGLAYDSGAYEYVPPATLASTGQNTQTYLALTAALTLPAFLLASSYICTNRKATNRA